MNIGLVLTVYFPPFSMQIVLFVSSTDAMQPGWLLTFLKSISPAQIKAMQRNLGKVYNFANLQDSTYFTAIHLCIWSLLEKFIFELCFQQFRSFICLFMFFYSNC